jgi:hypothetical protein
VDHLLNFKLHFYINKKPRKRTHKTEQTPT